MESAKVLIVEGHDVQRDLLAIVLRRDGYQVDTATDGFEALEKLQGGQMTEIVLVNTMLRKMGGLELTEKIKGDAKLKSLYVILMTPRINDSEHQRGFDLGADDFLTNPFSISDLLGRVRTGSRIVQLKAHNDQLEKGRKDAEK